MKGFIFQRNHLPALIFFILLGGFILLGFNVYTHTFSNRSQANATYNYKTQSIIKDFISNPLKATKKYSNHVIRLEGIIREIKTLDEQNIIILKYPDTDVGAICFLQNNRKSKQLIKGQPVSIKGLYSGFSKNVIMTNCIIIGNQKKYTNN